MITSTTNEKFKKFADHVFVNEGHRDSNQKDSASKCIPGKVHTVYGVTYCVFKERAARLGITPVTYERFYNLTKADFIKFLWDEYRNNPWYNLSESGAFAMTEANWLSGKSTWRHAMDTLIKFKIPNIPKVRKYPYLYTKAEQEQIIEAAKKIPIDKFWDTYTQFYYDWFDRLGKTAYGVTFRNGWLRRVREFRAFRDFFLKGDKIVGKESDPFFFPIVLIGSYFAYKMLKKR